jgi:hypothetical protein
MHKGRKVTGFTFELEPTHVGNKMGLRGLVGPFGEVEVHHTVYGAQKDRECQAVLYGAMFPEAVFSGGGRSGQPSLDGGWLKVDGIPVKTNFRVSGIRKGSRKLEMFHLGRKCVYTSAGEGKTSLLRREGVSITIGPGGSIPGKGNVRTGEVTGSADSADLAIAIIHEVVDTSVLTLGGALASTVFNILTPRNKEGYAE